jgi:hypothetical protein
VDPNDYKLNEENEKSDFLLKENKEKDKKEKK